MSDRKKLQNQCRRFMYDDWSRDLKVNLDAMVGKTRRQKWVASDTTYNWMRSINQQRSVSYDVEPIARNEGDIKPMLDEIRDSELWAMMPQIDRDTNGIQEMLIHTDIIDDYLTYRPVFPEFVDIETKPGTCEIIRLIEQRFSDVRKKKIFYLFDISDPSNPFRRVYQDEIKPDNDITSEVIGEDDYPYVYSDGEPFIPYNLRHAALTGEVWNPERSRQLLQATLYLGMGYSFYQHCVFHCGFPLRYSAGYRMVGADTREVTLTEGDQDEITAEPLEDPVDVIETDPAIILVLEQDGPNQGSVGQWNAGADPKSLMESIKLYEQGLVSLIDGLDQSDVIRTSGDAQAGVALVISMEGKRRQQRRQLPARRAADRQLLGMTAALLNRARGTAFPEEGWEITYPALPLGPSELDARRNDVLAQLSAGLISKREARRILNPDKSKEELVQMEQEIAAESAPIEAVSNTETEVSINTVT